MKHRIISLLLCLLPFSTFALDNKQNTIPIFEMSSDFEKIKSDYRNLKGILDNTNVIPDLKTYVLNLDWGDIYLHEWKGKLQEINYQLKYIGDKDSLDVAEFLFDKYGQGLTWVDEGNNPWGEWFELSDRSVKGFKVYSQGYRTISFSASAKLEEETRIKYSQK